MKQPVHGLELRHSLHHAVLTFVVGTIDKGAPDDRTAVGLQRVGEHVRTVGMTAVIVSRSGLSLTVGLNEETAEVRYQFVDLPCLALPPPLHGSVERICRLGLMQSQRRAEVDAQPNLDAVRAEQVRDDLEFLEIRARDHLGTGVDIVHHDGVDAHRGIGARVDRQAVAQRVGHTAFRDLLPFPDALSRIASLHTAVGVVPMVEHTPLQGGCRRPGGVPVIALFCLLPAQQRVGTVEQAEGAARGDHGTMVCCLVADGVSVVVATFGDKAQRHLTTLPALLQLTAGDGDGGRSSVSGDFGTDDMGGRRGLARQPQRCPNVVVADGIPGRHTINRCHCQCREYDEDIT